MAPLPLNIPPGIVKTKSLNGAQGRYTDCDKCRFVNGSPEKWKGWLELLDEPLQGMARGATSWVNEFGNTNIAIGTNLKLYAILGGDTLEDITPIRSSGTLGTDPFAVVDTETEVTVTHTAHGAGEGDFVTFDAATAGGGITIDGEYQITSIINDNSYTIEHSVAATSTDATTGGASVTFEYQISVGLSDATAGLGFGAGPFGSSTFGTPRAEGIAIQLRHWSVHEYGNELLASPFNGALYLWEEATDARAELVTNAPTDIRAMFVTPERFIFALRANKVVHWPDRDDPTDWTPSLDDTGNQRTLQSGSRLMNGVGLEGLSLVWTDTSVYVFQYDGSDLIYSDRLAGTGCGLVAAKAFCEVGGTAYWMSGQDFHSYAGGVTMIPNAEDIRQYVFEHETEGLDPDLVTKTWARYDIKNNQVRWHYVSRASTTNEPDRYVDVNLKDFSWTVGTYDGTTGTIFRMQDSSSVVVDSEGEVMLQDVGSNANGEAMDSFLTWGLYDAANGASNVDIMGVIPDCQRHVGPLEVEVFTYEYPNSDSVQDSDDDTLIPGQGIADIRVFGRHFSQTVRSNSIDGDYRFGIWKLETPDRLAGARR